MSGGHWDYLQYRFTDIIEDIKKEIENNKKPMPKEELQPWDEEDGLYSDWTDETILEFKKAHDCVSKAQIYLQRIDWLLSGDDGEESFHRRLNEDLEDYETKSTRKQ